MGVAYLPDGSLIDYREYITEHPRWKTVRQARFDFDDGRCAICHKDLHDIRYETHHLSYQRLGHEHLRDVITLCPECHKNFHQSWQQVHFWRGKEEGHWDMFDLEHTARLCATYWKQDKYICKDPDAPNMCGREVCRGLLDDYVRDFSLPRAPIIDPNDISLFVRNKRYELYFDAEVRGLSVEEFLDEYYGPKVRGKNPLRQEAGAKGSCFDHTPESFHKHYNENKNINLLMDKVREIETKGENHAET